MPRVEMLGNREHLVTVRLSEEQDTELRRRVAASGMSISDYVRDHLSLSFKEANNLEARMDDVERRLGRLEGLAHLD